MATFSRRVVMIGSLPHFIAAISFKKSSRPIIEPGRSTCPFSFVCSTMCKLSLVIVLFIFLTTPVANCANPEGSIFSPQFCGTAKTNAASQLPVKWPQFVGVHSDGNIGMTVNCSGQLGFRFLSGYIDDPESDLPPTSFVMPPRSNQQYLFAGGLWIGGVVNGDSIVSAGANGWNYYSQEFRPDEAGPGTVRLQGGVADKQFVATYSDTVGESFYLDPRIEGLAVRERTCSWVTPPYNDFILYELTIRNIGPNPIFDTWFGYYIDCDVYAMTTIPIFGHTDDFGGLRRVSGIAYIMDNDGDPLINGDYTWNEESIRGVFGMKLIEMSPPAIDTSFNWWMRTTDGGSDWGPRYIGDTSQPLYVFDGGGNGQPTTDRDRYYLLSNSEIDYDFLWMTFMKDDPNWLPNPTSGGNLDRGFDFRYLYSFGGFDLMPGDSVRFVFALVGGEEVHVEPDDFVNYFDNEVPEKLYYHFDFSDLEKNAAAAKALYESEYVLAPPLGSVQGTEIVSVAGDGVHIQWLPREHPDMIGYNIYIAAVPDSQSFFSDTVLRYRDTSSMVLYNVDSVISGTQYVINGLTEGLMYFYSVATVSSAGEGRKSKPAYFTYGFPNPPMTDSTTEYISAGGLFTISWLPTDDDIDHYNIYKRVGYGEFSKSYGPTVYRLPEYLGDPYDSVAYYIQDDDTTALYFFKMEPIASVPADDTLFIDSAVNADLYYFITAVDAAGRESELSTPIHVFVRDLIDKDILIYLPNAGKTINVQSIDSLMAFYDRVFAGRNLTYDYFFLIDSAGMDGCEEYACMGWSTMAPYRFVLFDDNLRDATLYYEVYGSFTNTLKDYINTGGNLIYFGNLLNGYSSIFLDTLTLRFQPGIFEYDILHLDSLRTLGLTLYSDGIISDEDTLGGLIRAEPALDEFPELYVDTAFYWWNASFYMAYIWPIETPPMTGCLFPRAPAETIYYYRSLYPETSQFEGMPCGVRYSMEDADVYSFIMHPWFFGAENIRDLINTIIEQAPVSAPDDDPVLPDEFALYQNYPNPFNPSTTIEYYLPRTANVQMDIYNILGQKVRVLTADRVIAGHHSIIWDGNDSHGKPVSTGVYFYRLRADDFIRTEKMLLLK